MSTDESDDPEAREARRIVALFDQQPTGLVTFLSGQLSVVKSQAQLLMGLCGLTITVTGFSGHLMVRAGLVSTLSMVIGILLILGAIVLTLRTLGKLRWVTQDLSDDLVHTAHVIIRRRNHEQRQLQIAGFLVAGGLGGYLLAVVAAALYNGNFS